MKPRLLVFERHHLGDAIMALPFLKAAARSFRITVFCRPQVAALLREVLTDLETVSSEKWSGVFSRLPKLEKTDVAVCAWPDTRAHCAMKKTGAGQRIGFRVSSENFYGVERPWRKRRLLLGRLLGRILSLTGPLLTRELDRHPGQLHGENWTQLAGALGLTPDFSFPWFPPGRAPEGWNTFLAEARSSGRKILALHPGGRFPEKRWPVEKFQELLGGFLSAPTFSVAIIQPPGEACPLPRTPHQRVFAPASIPALAALFAEADGVLCNDSMASHLAAAMGVPVAAIFGSGDPSWFAPHGNAARAIATNVCPHRPCIDRCVMPSPVCLESVSIRLVEQQLSAMFPDPSKNPIP